MWKAADVEGAGVLQLLKGILLLGLVRGYCVLEPLERHRGRACVWVCPPGPKPSPGLVFDFAAHLPPDREPPHSFPGKPRRGISPPGQA